MRIMCACSILALCLAAGCTNAGDGNTAAQEIIPTDSAILGWRPISNISFENSAGAGEAKRVEITVILSERDDANVIHALGTNRAVATPMSMIDNVPLGTTVEAFIIQRKNRLFMSAVRRR